jgi:hypothetical protein
VIAIRLFRQSPAFCSDRREYHKVRRKVKGAMNLALLRNAILAIIRPEEHASPNQAFLHYANHCSEAIRLLT